ncbi:hypothetical protein PT974_03142 [Cladobotryum mycophilum]|uniref:Uncharacterized protein n=1 Tax=Cladobotryum mycophilum TaxID=491253 RepID=A0ABR0SRU0_9HYPO
MATITVSRGDWRNPTYTLESKDEFYASMRKPLGGTSGHDPTTLNLTQDLRITGTKTAADIMKAAVRSEFQFTNGIARGVWTFCMGYFLHGRVSDRRMAVAVGTAAIEMTSDYASFEMLRQEMLDSESIADDSGDSEMRADARRALIEYYHIRMFRRVIGVGNAYCEIFDGEGLASLAAGGSWTGTTYEVCTLAFPELAEGYAPMSMIDMFAALANAIASLPRDQREGTTNALIPVYKDTNGDLAADLKVVRDWLDTTNGPLLSIAGHYVASGNIHARYCLLGVFLAAARLAKISLATSRNFYIWKEKAVAYSRRVAVPQGHLTTTQTSREQRIDSAINKLWKTIKVAEQDGSDDGFAIAHRTLHKFIDQEAMTICWKTADPAVLWAVLAALFWTMINVDEMAELLMRGDEFKSLYLESEGFEDVWLREIYASNP